jgi:hypothetical protein
VLSGRGLCDEVITRPEESYRLYCIVVYDLETSGIGAPYIYDISHLRVNACRIDAHPILCLPRYFENPLMILSHFHLLLCLFLSVISRTVYYQVGLSGLKFILLVTVCPLLFINSPVKKTVWQLLPVNFVDSGWYSPFHSVFISVQEADGDYQLFQVRTCVLITKLNSHWKEFH